jgi:hypothetical protein
VGIDRPHDADEPSGEPSRPPADRPDPIERRSREEYRDDLRASMLAASGKPWGEVTGWSGRVWAGYQRKFPPEERTPIDRSGDPPGSWRGNNNRFLDRPANEEVEEECDNTAKWEREKCSPALLETETRDPDRHLVGFEHRLKGRDRIKEKVAEAIEQYDRSPKEAVSDVPDAVRYTFQYEESRYTQGVYNDVERLKEQGFELLRLKNSWSGEQYKGINSQWIDPDSGRRFEVQFHTPISFEAKQITHGAYERLRSEQADEFEEMVLEAFQQKVTAEVPIPVGATDIPDYP